MKAPQLAITTAACLLLFAGGAVMAEEIGEQRITTIAAHAPEQVAWSPSGEFIWISSVSDLAGISTLQRCPMTGAGTQAIRLKGTIRAFWASPHEDAVASIHEDGRERVLEVWDTKTWEEKEVRRDQWSIYFPVVNTVTPWDASGEHMLFYTARFHERKLWLWERSNEGVRIIGEGRRKDRAFWGPNGSVIIPQGRTLEQVLGGEGDVIRCFEELDLTNGKRRKRVIPEGYNVFFPFLNVNRGMLKDPDPPPLLVDLSSWQVSTLPESIGRFMEVAWAPEGDRLAYPATGSGFRSIELFDLKTGESKLLWVDAANLIGSLVWSPSGKYLAFSLLEAKGETTERVVILDLAAGEPIWSRERRPELAKVYYRRARKSLIWHPVRDALLLWDHTDLESGELGTEFRVVEVKG